MPKWKAHWHTEWKPGWTGILVRHYINDSSNSKRWWMWVTSRDFIYSDPDPDASSPKAIWKNKVVWEELIGEEENEQDNSQGS